MYCRRSLERGGLDVFRPRDRNIGKRPAEDTACPIGDRVPLDSGLLA